MVDVHGTDRVGNAFAGVQCDGKDASYGGAVTEKQLRGEIAKALADAAVIVVPAYPNGKPPPARLPGSTSLTSPRQLAADNRGLAARRAGRLRSRLP